MSAAGPPASSLSTIDFDDVAARQFDAIVVGAGPAGAIAAREVARLGRQVLLVERAKFPRWKVCGCCLNGAAIDALARIGLADLPPALGAKRLERWQLCSPAGRISRALPAGLSLSREALDAALVQRAIDEGVSFIDKTTASLDQPHGDIRSILLKRLDRFVRVPASVIVGADGLSGRLLENVAGFEWITARRSRIGTGTVIEDTSPQFEDNVIYMSCAPGGYVGLVRLEDGRLDVASALDRHFVRKLGTPTEAAIDVLRRSGLSVPPGLATAVWRGTPSLTRKRRRLAGHGIFVIGDSAGYVEPFTGEGIAWAILTAIAVAPLVDAAIEQMSTRLAVQWTQRHRAIVGRAQRNCRLIGGILKRPAIATAAVRVLQVAPWLSNPVIRAINTPNCPSLVGADRRIP